MKLFGFHFFSVAFLCALLPESSAQTAFMHVSQHHPDWSYGDGSCEELEDWHKHKGYERCGGNKKQSPVSLLTKESAWLNNELNMMNYRKDEYALESIEVDNDGHTVNVKFNYGIDPDITEIPHINGGNLDGNYVLCGIHFHWGSESSRGSEHTINGRRYPIEVHLVHIRSNYKDIIEAREQMDGVAVLGAVYKISETNNKRLDKLLGVIQKVRYCNETAPMGRFNIYDLLPKNHEEIYSYFGSLTTPPCNEAVTWNVIRDPGYISEAQMEVFRSLQSRTRENSPLDNMPISNNFRCLKPLSGRKVQELEAEMLSPLGLYKND